MPERDYTNDYDAWLLNQPYEWQGKPEPPQGSLAPAPAASGPYTAANPPPSGSAPAGTQWMLNPTTGQFEAIPIGTMPPWGPRTSDPGAPPPTVAPPTPPPDPNIYYPPPTGGDNGGFSSGGAYDASGFAWPQFNAPRFSAPTPFSYEAFKAPGFDDIFADPSYKGRRDEGLQAIEHGAAARGLTRLPNTLKALGAWNQDFASREYGNIFDRSAQTYDRNRNNAADTYSRNYGISRDVFDRDYTSARDSFDFNEFQPSKLTFDDMYRRWRDELDATTRVATAGADGY